MPENKNFVIIFEIHLFGKLSEAQQRIEYSQIFGIDPRTFKMRSLQMEK